MKLVVPPVAYFERLRGQTKRKIEPERWAPELTRRRCEPCATAARMSDPTLPEPCDDHRFFRCIVCKRWQPWTKGATDGVECDPCWARKKR